MGSNRVATHEDHWSELIKDESNGKNRSLKVKKKKKKVRRKTLEKYKMKTSSCLQLYFSTQWGEHWRQLVDTLPSF